MTIHARLAALSAIVLLPAALQAQTPAPAPAPREDRWTPELSMKFRGIQSTAVSPAGDRIAYVINQPVMEGEKSEYLAQIWMVSVDGTRNQQFTRGEKSATSPSFSPDGKWLAFTSSRSGKNQVWLISVDGGEAEQLTDVDPGVGGYKWAADGSQIGFTLSDAKTEDEKKAEREKRDVILADQNFKFSHLYVVPLAEDAQGKRTHRQVTKGQFTVGGFDWSPDGRTIAFAHQPDPRLDQGDLSDISTVEVASGRVSPLITWVGSDGQPLYSPDGQWIAFVSTGAKAEPIGLGDVHLVAATGGTPRKLADTPDRSAQLLGWSRDGSQIYAAEFVRTTRQVLALPVNGSAARPITSGQGVHGAVSINRSANRLAFTFETTDVPAEVHTSTIASYAPVKLTSVHADVARPPLGKTVLLSWKARDGREIEGLLTYPIGYQQGRKYPLILNVHGGPAGVFAQSFTGGPGIYMLQYFAQNGFAILRPNPRGSTGYGKDFRFANFKDWGYGDFQDLMSGVDHAISLGVAHPDSLALMGWSYGGYMTSWAVTQTDRFKAASMGAGLPNLVSMVTTTDIGDYLVGHMGGEFWDDYDTYEKHSAIYQIKNVKTPTQVIHGQNDLRVPFTQGQEFYRALLRRGVPTEFIILPRTPHGPTEPKLLMEVSPRILKWFDNHLKRKTQVISN